MNIFSMLNTVDKLDKLGQDKPYGCTINFSMASDNTGTSMGMHMKSTDDLDVHVEHEDDNFLDAFTGFCTKASEALEEAQEAIKLKNQEQDEKEQKRAELEEKMAALQAELDSLDCHEDEEISVKGLALDDILDDDYLNSLRKMLKDF